MLRWLGNDDLARSGINFFCIVFGKKNVGTIQEVLIPLAPSI